jgi:hypothetical protein
MLRFGSMVATAALLLSADVSGVLHWRPPATQPVEFPTSENLPVLPDMSPANDQDQAAPAKSAAKSDKSPDKTHDENIDKPKDESLQPESRLTLVRYLDSEYVRVLQPLPAGKNGFHIKAGAALNDNQLRMTLGAAGSAINPGDKAQITSLEFKDRQIIVDINGGGRGKKRLRDRIHMEVGGIPTMTEQQPDTTAPANAGATIFLDFDAVVPDLTPDQLKQELSSVLDFSKQHSAAVQWVDTLPPDIQKAIQDKRPAVGMDREMVLAALGRPDRKVREKEDDGSETEDWIYGKPPAKTIFVKFDGDKVTKVEQFPQ